MPSMTPMMSLIFFELTLMSFMVLITSETTAPPRAATSPADDASWLACRDASAVCRTVFVN